jgi:peptide/nickel transport system substrate-binding protein
MKNILKVLFKVIKSFSLEEKVLASVFVFLGIFFGIKGVAIVFNPASVFADSGVYTEGLISTKQVLINPLYVDFSNANRDVSSLVFSGLLKYDPKFKGFVDDLANLTISEDKQEYILTLKDDVKWHDGSSLTADDVIFTYNIIQDPDFQNPLIRANFEGVKIEKINEKSVKFIITRPNSFFITNLNVGILPKHLLEGVSVHDLLTNQFNLKPVGTGPYKVLNQLEVTPDGKQKVTLVLNESYYSFKPTIREVRFIISPDEDTLLKEKSSLNVVSKINGRLVELLNDSRFGVKTYSLPQYTAIFFNTESQYLKSSKVRVGMIKSIDKDGLLSKLTNKSRVDTPLMDLNQKEWINKPDLNEANGAFFDSGLKFKKDDKGQLVEGEQFRRDKEGKEVEMVLLARIYDPNSSLSIDTAKTVEYLVESWKKAGIKISVKYLDETEFMDSIKSRDYDMVLAGQSMGYNLDTFTFWHSSQAKENGANLANLKSFPVDQQIEKIRETFDLAEKEERQKKLAELISKEAPALFLYRSANTFLTDDKVKNIELDNLAFESDRFANVRDWCIGKECKN